MEINVSNNNKMYLRSDIHKMFNRLTVHTNKYKSYHRNTCIGFNINNEYNNVNLNVMYVNDQLLSQKYIYKTKHK